MCFVAVAVQYLYSTLLTSQAVLAEGVQSRITINIYPILEFQGFKKSM